MRKYHLSIYLSMHVIFVDGWRRVGRISRSVITPIWPANPNARVEEYEQALLAAIPPEGRLVILTHSYGSCIVERCLYDDRISWSRIERLEHYNPLFCFSRFDRLAIRVFRGNFFLSKRMHPIRGCELLRATDGLRAVYGEVYATRGIVALEAFCRRHGVDVTTEVFFRPGGVVVAEHGVEILSDGPPRARGR